MTTKANASRQAIILAAGRGERMRPLTDETPKPLLKAGGQRLIEHQIQALKRAGIVNITINISHLAEQFVAALGDGSGYGVSIRYSKEPPGALETAGGIALALHRRLLTDGPFVVTNGDVYCDIDYTELALADGELCQLVMVDNPDYHRNGDFHYRDGRLLTQAGSNSRRLTYAGLGLYRPQLFASLTAAAANSPTDLPPRHPLGALLRDAIATGRAGAHYYRGDWMSVDTQARLRALDQALAPA